LARTASLVPYADLAELWRPHRPSPGKLPVTRGAGSIPFGDRSAHLARACSRYSVSEFRNRLDKAQDSLLSWKSKAAGVQSSRSPHLAMLQILPRQASGIRDSSPSFDRAHSWIARARQALSERNPPPSHERHAGFSFPFIEGRLGNFDPRAER